MVKNLEEKMELTILIPCLNEEKTVAACVKQAATFLREKAIVGEVLVCDNGSKDGSYALAKEAGARVISCQRKGYGSALQTGIKEARGIYVIMGDCDLSYHFDEIMPLLEELRKGSELVVGDRFFQKCEKNAMPFWHKYLGVPLLSFLGRLFFSCKVRDFHCGLRGIKKESYEVLNCKYSGMEFATEMIGRASMKGQVISQVPVKLYCDQRGRPSHLRSIRDGMRHLAVIVTKCRI